jgi:thiol-disulfide isomerase/thioredoxin
MTFVVIRPTARIRSVASIVWMLVAGAALAIATQAHAPPAAQAQTAPMTGAPGWLGVSLHEPTPGRVHVRDVLLGSPAEAAGLRAGDVILRVGSAQPRDAREVVQAVSSHRAGEHIAVEVERGGKQVSVRVRLAPVPSGEQLLRMQHVGRAAPELQGLRTSIGTRGPTLADFRGRVIVLDFWASWCTACRLTSDHLNRWHERYAAQGLAVLGVAAEEPEAVAHGTRRFRIHYPTFADPRTQTSATYHVGELPAVVIIDRNGVVRDVATGFDAGRLRELEALLGRLLNESAPAGSSRVKRAE